MNWRAAFSRSSGLSGIAQDLDWVSSAVFLVLARLPLIDAPDVDHGDREVGFLGKVTFAEWLSPLSPCGFNILELGSEAMLAPMP